MSLSPALSVAFAAVAIAASPFLPIDLGTVLPPSSSSSPSWAKAGDGRNGSVIRYHFPEAPGQVVALKAVKIASEFYHEKRMYEYLYYHGYHGAAQVLGFDPYRQVLVMRNYSTDLLDLLSGRGGRDPPSLLEILRLFRQCVELIAQLHALGIAHNDIKLENFLFDSGRVYLADLGTASPADQAWMDGVQNTAAYHCPSNLPKVRAVRNLPFRRTKADVFALASCLAVMLFKKYIFGAESKEVNGRLGFGPRTPIFSDLINYPETPFCELFQRRAPEAGVASMSPCLRAVLDASLVGHDDIRVSAEEFMGLVDDAVREQEELEGELEGMYSQAEVLINELSAWASYRGEDWQVDQFRSQLRMCRERGGASVLVSHDDRVGAVERLLSLVNDAVLTVKSMK